jgi:hypothetical protein
LSYYLSFDAHAPEDFASIITLLCATIVASELPEILRLTSLRPFHYGLKERCFTSHWPRGSLQKLRIHTIALPTL